MNFVSLFAQNFSFSRKRTTPNPPASFSEQPPKPFWREIFTARWVRILIAFLAFLVFLLLWNQINYQFTVVIFTILPLFVGYGLSYLLEPISRFFQQFFSKRTSQFLVFIFFLIFALALVLGLFFLFFIQLNGLYKKFFYQTGNLETFLRDLDKYEIKELTLNRISDPDFDFKLTYQTLEGSGWTGKEITFAKKSVAGVFILLLQISTSFQFLQGICFSLISWLNKNVTNYGYLQILWGNWQGIVLILYLLFFTIVIGAFSLGKGRTFFGKLWHFFAKDYEPDVAQKLKVDLKKNLSAWARGLLIVELYIMVGTGISVFTAGIIFSSWSSYVEASIVLTLFMTLCNLIPYIGPVIGFSPIVTIGLIDVVSEGADVFLSWVPLIIAFGGCFLVQIGESTVVSPLVYSHQVKLSPITIIMGLAVAGVIFGIFWMPLAIPVILITKIFYQTLYQQKDEKLKSPPT